MNTHNGPANPKIKSTLRLQAKPLRFTRLPEVIEIYNLGVTLRTYEVFNDFRIISMGKGLQAVFCILLQPLPDGRVGGGPDQAGRNF